jgi:Histidine kinase-, DNA gyrase B-, and HSP90-like ATPase
MTERMELPPDPVRMVEGLRDTGYQFVTAVADIVDNSIAAEASLVSIDLGMDYRGNIFLAIYDDGTGMDRDALINAMKYGSRPRPSPSSLGKFGLGLKTASTAFCRRLSVISRSRGEDELLRATWDLDQIHTANRWELLIDPPTKEEVEQFVGVIGPRKGTLVMWQKVDRLLKNYSNQGGGSAKKALSRFAEDLRDHLSMVFQRFLDPTDERARHVRMLLNGDEVQRWDPFCSGESQIVSQDTPEVELRDAQNAKFQMKAFVLPRKEEFSSEGAARAARVSNANQGIYIYRENRLIHGPDWLRMFSKEPHLSLLRVEFSFDHMLDEAFQIDIKKSQIILNEALYDHLLDFLTPPRRAAEEVYRKGRKTKIADIAKTAHDSSNRNISSKAGEVSKPDVQEIDVANGEAQLLNSQGTVRLKLKITTASKPLEVNVQPADSIDDGLLWEPCLIDGNCGVRINTSHPYYGKVYIPNLAQGVTIQGMDALLWGLSVAELNCVSNETKSTFGELRYEVSRSLRKLVQDLPEPPDTV